MSERANEAREASAILAERNGAPEEEGRRVRCIDCKASVEISPAGVAYWRAANRLLASRGERPLGEREVKRCDPCYRRWQERLTHESHLELKELREVLTELNRNRVVPQERIARVLAAGFGDTLKAFLAARDQLASSSRARVPE